MNGYQASGIPPISLVSNTKEEGIRHFVMATKWLNIILQANKNEWISILYSCCFIYNHYFIAFQPLGYGNPPFILHFKPSFRIGYSVRLKYKKETLKIK
jgi:hypothetical protein